MARISKAIKDGLKAALEGDGGVEYEAAGRKVQCGHCGGTLFHVRQAQLNTAGFTLFNLDWANATGTALVCANCSLIHWFLHPPERPSR